MTGTDGTTDRWDEGFDPRPADPCEEAAVRAVLASSGELAAAGAGALEAHRSTCPRCAAEAGELARAADRASAALRSV